MEADIQFDNYILKTPMGGTVGEIQSISFIGVGPEIHKPLHASVWSLPCFNPEMQIMPYPTVSKSYKAGPG